MTYFDRYEMRNGTTYVYKYNTVTCKETEYELCEEVKVVRRRRQMYKKNSPIVVDVCIKDSNESVTLEDIPRSTLVKTPVDYFSDFGLTISNLKEYDVTLGEILQDTEKAVPMQYEYNKLGYIVHSKKLYYAANSIYPVNTSLCLKDGIATQSMGTFDSWRDALLPYIEENPKLQLALAIAASAPVLKLLQYCNVMHESMLFAFVGASSTAKTMSMSLGCSVFGKPTVGDGMIDTMVDTENYFFSQLAKKSGVVHCVDEATLENRNDFTKMIYQVSMQHERGRLNGDGTPKESRKWVSTVIFTGERSLLDMTNGNAGLFARMIEFNHVWTKDGKSADEIYKIINENYGTAWSPLIKSLATLEKSGVLNLYEENLKSLESLITTFSGVGNRILSKFAVLLATVDVIQDAWQMKFDKEEITSLLVERYKEIVKGDVVYDAYESLLAHIVENGNLFPVCGKNDFTCVNFDKKHGIYSDYKGRKCVWMMSDKFEKFVADIPNVNLNMLRKSFKERGYIAYFDESYLRKQTLGVAEVSCYCIYLDYGTHVDEKKDKVKVNVNKPKVQKKSQMINLLEEDVS